MAYSLVLVFKREMGCKRAREHVDLPGLGMVTIIDSSNSEGQESFSFILFREIVRCGTSWDVKDMYGAVLKRMRSTSKTGCKELREEQVNKRRG